MIVIENNKYFVRFSLEGGQINRFRDKLLNIEYVSEPDINDWNYSTPTLFPIIGSSYNQKYHFSGQETTMKNHGILRDFKFILMSNKDNQVVLKAEANSETLKAYPFYFSILITYTLVGPKLKVEYEISNDGVIDMPFNFGLHPAFNVPLTPDKNFEDYKIVFSTPTKLLGDGPMVNSGLVKEIDLSKEAFVKYPTWLYHNVNSDTVAISDGTHGVKVSTVGFPVFAIWSKPDKDSHFVCLEPWQGVGKKIEKDLEFHERDAVLNLKANRKLLLTYTIEVF